MKMTFQPKKRQRSKVNPARRACGMSYGILRNERAASNCGLFFSQVWLKGV